jgi:hypothetical protein
LYARGTAVQSSSDVDVLADFERSKRLTLFSLAGLRLRVVDILGSYRRLLRMIEAFTLGMSFEQFREDPKTVAAVEGNFW